jgi:hypothetical protein
MEALRPVASTMNRAWIVAPAEISRCQPQSVRAAPKPISRKWVWIVRVAGHGRRWLRARWGREVVGQDRLPVAGCGGEVGEIFGRFVEHDLVDGADAVTTTIVAGIRRAVPRTPFGGGKRGPFVALFLIGDLDFGAVHRGPEGSLTKPRILPNAEAKNGERRTQQTAAAMAGRKNRRCKWLLDANVNFRRASIRLSIGYGGGLSAG